MLTNILLGALYVLLFVPPYMLFRNHRVFIFRIKILEEDHQENAKKIKNNDPTYKLGYSRYDRMPSYNYMMYHFWIWPLTKFLPKD
jgi:hypothetical protein